MLYAATFIIGALIGYASSKINEFIDAMDEQRGCNQDCDQGRRCTCRERG
jgi:hypothetical protein